MNVFGKRIVWRKIFNLILTVMNDKIITCFLITYFSNRWFIYRQSLPADRVIYFNWCIIVVNKCNSNLYWNIVQYINAKYSRCPVAVVSFVGNYYLELPYMYSKQMWQVCVICVYCVCICVKGVITDKEVRTVISSVPDPGSGAFFTPRSGIDFFRMSDSGSPTHIFESLVTIFWVRTSIILWPKFFSSAFWKYNIQFCEICGYKKSMTTNILSPLSFVALFGFGIRDPGSGMG